MDAVQQFTQYSPSQQLADIRFELEHLITGLLSISQERAKEDAIPCCEKNYYHSTLMLRDCLEDNKTRRCVSTVDISKKQVKISFERCNV